MRVVRVRRSLILLLMVALATAAPALADSASEDRQLRAAETDQYETSRLPALELQVLGAARGRAKRQGDQLILVLLDGRRIVLQSHDDCPAGAITEQNCVEFYLVSDLPTRHAYIIKAAYYEGGEVRIIDDRSGRASVLQSIPRFPPDSTELVTVDNGAVYGEPGIQIWRAESDGWTLEWRDTGKTDPVDHETFLTAWTDRDEIVLEFQSTKHKWPAWLKRELSGWRLETQWPTE